MTDRKKKETRKKERKKKKKKKKMKQKGDTNKRNTSEKTQRNLHSQNKFVLSTITEHKGAGAHQFRAELTGM